MFKKILIIFASILVILYLLINLFVYLYISKDKFEEFVALPVKEASGLLISIDNLSADFWWGLNIELSGLHIINRNYINDSTLLFVNHLSIKNKLMDLLTGTLKVNDIILTEAYIHFQLSERAFLPIENTNISSDTGATLIELPDMVIPNIQFKQCRFFFNNLKDSIRMLVTDMNLTHMLTIENNRLILKNDIKNDSIDIQFKNQYQLISTQNKIEADLTYSFDEKQLNISNSRFKLLNILGDFSMSMNFADTMMPFDFKISSQQVDLKNLLSQMAFKQKDNIENFNGQFSYQIEGRKTEKFDFNANLILDKISFNLRDNQAKLNEISGRFRADMNELNIDNFILIAENQKAIINGSVKYGNDIILDLQNAIQIDVNFLKRFNSLFEPQFKLIAGSLKGDMTIKGKLDFSKKIYPLINGNYTVKNFTFSLGNIAKHEFTMSADLKINTQTIKSDNLIFKTRGIEVYGTLSANHYLNSLNRAPNNKITVQAQLKSPMTDITTIMTVLNDSASIESHKLLSKEEKNKVKYFQLLEPFNISASVFIEKFKFNKFTMNQIKGFVTHSNKTIKFSDLSLFLYKGKISGSGYIDYLEKDKLNLNSQLNLKGTEINEINTEILEIPNKIYGNINASGHLTSSFDDTLGIISKSIESNLQFEILEGKLKNIETIKKMGQYIKFLNFDSVMFTKWNSELTVKDEKMNLSNVKIDGNEFQINSNNAQITFNGDIQIPLLVTLNKNNSERFKNESDAFIKSILKYLTNSNGEIELEIECKGKLASPQVVLNTKKAEERLKSDAKKKLEDEAKKLLKKWF